MKILIFFFFTITIISCQPALDIEAEKAKIQAQIDLIGEAHFAKNAAQFYAPNADSFYDVRRGHVQKVNKADLIGGTQSYLDSMDFQELKRTHEPIIEISDDGTLASYIGAIVVKGYLSGSPVFWVVSWQSVLKKINNEWKIISTANTETPPEANASVILQNVKEAIGQMPDNGSINAMANCQGPIGEFKTLMFSRQSDGRMEQSTNNGHVILKHGDSVSWTQNLASQKLNNTPDKLTKLFIKGHEFHWLSFRPEDRLSKPVFKEFIEFKGQSCFKIEFKDALDRSVYFYYAFDDYTPLGFDNPTSSQEEMVTVSFANWKDLNGLKVFEKVIIEEGNDIWQYNFSDIKINSLKNEDFENKSGYIED